MPPVTWLNNKLANSKIKTPQPTGLGADVLLGTLVWINADVIRRSQEGSAMG